MRLFLFQLSATDPLALIFQYRYAPVDFRRWGKLIRWDAFLSSHTKQNKVPGGEVQMEIKRTGGKLHQSLQSHHWEQSGSSEYSIRNVTFIHHVFLRS